MSKHTPGPWTVRYAGTAVVYGDQQIAIIPTRVDGYDAEQQANARLIAAAPEMLRVLHALVGAPPEFGENGVCKLTTREVVDMARAAIAKAEQQSLDGSNVSKEKGTL